MQLKKIVLSLLLCMSAQNFTMDNEGSQRDDSSSSSVSLPKPLKRNRSMNGLAALGGQNQLDGGATLPSGVSYDHVPKFEESSTCQNVMGCEFVAVCQGLYIKKHPSSKDSIKTKSSELPADTSLEVRKTISRELLRVAEMIPNLDRTIDGETIVPKENSKKEGFVPFSKNFYYPVVMGVLKPLNTPQGLNYALYRVEQGRSLGLVPNTQLNLGCVIGAHKNNKDEKNPIVICKSCTPKVKKGIK